MKSRLKKVLIVSLLALQVFFYPMTALAATAPANDASTEAPSSDQSQTSETSPTQPTGPEAPTYTYNAATGLWENEHYTWNPATKQTSPKVPPTYSYNPVTGMWDTTEYKYDAAKGAYIPQQVSTAQPPANAVIAKGETPATATPSQATTPAAPHRSSTGSNNFDLFYNNSISNAVHSTATSGDATVSNNTKAGNATTGNAAAAATILNIIQTSFGLQPNSVNTFTSDIYGSQVGDIHLDPNKLPAGSRLSVKDRAQPDLTIKVDQNNKITNDIDLTATSGNASVLGNTTAGNAQSGNALAVANVVNMINSSISTGQSFIGNINIYGELDGDILMPEGLKQQLLSGNAPTANIDVSKMENAEIVAEFTTNSLIENNIHLDATTGDATVDSNTAAGSATSGEAKTNLTVLNLTGQQVIGSNAMLVFVNVMGKWVGAIMNAPTGTTAATLGNQGSSMTSTGNTHITGNITNTIENNITVQATSGDATVAGNTTAGDATSGDATAGANVLNIANTGFSLTDWFGILFINVFGSWNGSFGMDTAAGGTAPSGGNPGGTPGGSSSTPPMVAFRINPGSNGGFSLSPVQRAAPPVSEQAAQPTREEPKEEPQVLTASTTSPTPSADNTNTKGFGWPVTASIVAIFIGLALMGLERLLAGRRHNRVPAGHIVRA